MTNQIKLTEEKIKVIDSEIDRKIQERSALMTELKLLKNHDQDTAAAKWGIVKDVTLPLYVVGFTKYTSIHCLLAAMYKIDDVDLVVHRFKSLLHEYWLDEYDYELRTTRNCTSFHDIPKLEQKYDLYIIDSETFGYLHNRLSHLELKTHNLATIEAEICNVAIKKINS